jgi:hypothetical protein
MRTLSFPRRPLSALAVLAALTTACPAVDPGAIYVVEGVVRSADTSEPLNGLVVDCGSGAPVVTGGGRATVGDGGVVEGCGEPDEVTCEPGHYRCEGGGLGTAGDWQVRLTVLDPAEVFVDLTEDISVRAGNTDPPPTTSHDVTLARR